MLGRYGKFRTKWRRVFEELMDGYRRNGSLKEVSEGLETLRKDYLVAARKILERRRREEGWNSKEARRRVRSMEYGTRMRWVKAMKEFRKLG